MAKKILGSIFLILLVGVFAWRNWPTTDKSPSFNHPVQLFDHIQVSFEKEPEFEEVERDGVTSKVYFAYRRGLSAMVQGLAFPEDQMGSPIARERQRIFEQDVAAFEGTVIQNEKVMMPFIGQHYILENYNIDDSPEKRMEVFLYQTENYLFKIATVWEVDKEAAADRAQMYFRKFVPICSFDPEPAV